MRFALIVNPRASRVDDALVQAVERVLRPGVTLRTERRDHATQLAREIDADAVAVLGGDGTANEVVNGLERDVPVGFLPGGGANVLARALGLPRDAAAAARVVAAGRTRRISLGRVNGRRFTFSAGIGLDAAAVRRVEALGRARDGRRAGDVAFALSVLRALPQYREPQLDVEGLGRATAALVANGDPYTYAGPIAVRVAPEARFELGLDLVAPVAIRAGMIPRFVTYVLRGRGQERDARILYAHDRDRFAVRCDVPLPLQADGEDLGDVDEAVFEAERDALTVIA